MPAAIAGRGFFSKTMTVDRGENVYERAERQLMAERGGNDLQLERPLSRIDLTFLPSLRMNENDLKLPVGKAKSGLSMQK